MTALLMKDLENQKAVLNFFLRIFSLIYIEIHLRKDNLGIEFYTLRFCSSERYVP